MKELVKVNNFGQKALRKYEYLQAHYCDFLPSQNPRKFKMNIECIRVFKNV